MRTFSLVQIKSLRPVEHRISRTTPNDKCNPSADEDAASALTVSPCIPGVVHGISYPIQTRQLDTVLQFFTHPLPYHTTTTAAISLAPDTDEINTILFYIPIYIINQTSINSVFSVFFFFVSGKTWMLFSLVLFSTVTAAPPSPKWRQLE